MTKLLGKSEHQPQCECNFTRFVSATGEKCCKKYGTKRARAREKASFRRDLTRL